jgi:pullulanase
MGNDTVVKIKSINPGIYRYYEIREFLKEEDELKIEDSHEDYSYIVPGYSILSSRNILSKGVNVQLVLVKYYNDNCEFSKNLDWKIETDIEGIKINKNGILKIENDTNIKNDTDIIVYTEIKGEKIEKEIRVITNDPISKCNYIVHYYRHDNNYDGWNIWSWCDNCADLDGEEINFYEENDFGRLAGINKVSFKLRKYNWIESLQKMSFGDVAQNEIYANDLDWDVQTDFLSAVEGIAPRIQCAIMDNKEYITAYYSNLKLYDTEFFLVCNGKKIKNVTYKIEGNKITFELPKNFTLIPDNYYEVKATNFFRPVKVTLRNVLDEFYYEKDDLGLTFNNESVIFKIWAPTAKHMDLFIYDNYDDKDGSGKKHKMNKDLKDGIFKLNINKNKVLNKYYNFKVYIYPDSNDENINFANDPYAKAVSVNGIKGAIVDINNKYDLEVTPANFFKTKRPKFNTYTDAVIYEMNVRDYTIDNDSGIKNKGKYLGLCEEGTLYNNNPNIKTGIDHLIELGVNCVQIMPIFDYKTVDEREYNKDDYNWGYDPQNYNVPEGSYSTDSFNPKSRIVEIRKMIQKLHEKDISVVMDVVYNHTYEINLFDNIVPGYYYRTNDLLRYSDGSGCGMEIATERLMVRKFILDSLLHWYNNYQIDGFRFDLMGLYDKESMNIFVGKLKENNKNILIYGEPWKGGWSTLPWHNSIFKGSQRLKGYGVFSDNFRNALRGDNGIPKPSSGYLTNDYFKKEEVFKGVMGAINDFTEHPNEVINYVSCHDNYLLYDQIAASLYENYSEPFVPYNRDIDHEKYMENEIVKRCLLGSGIILTSQGVAFIHSGDEFLRTKYGDHNSYNSSDDINMIRWKWKEEYIEVFKYYKKLIELRKGHSAFKIDNRNTSFKGCTHQI